jgi:protein SFI1
MPPPPSAHDHGISPAELSDQGEFKKVSVAAARTKIRADIELLHQIVLRAQQRHDVHKQPKRALFEAYEKVFEENGLDTRQDRACFRVVLQLGEPQIPGDLLYDKFEFLLRQIGVRLAFGDDESPAQNHQEAVAEAFADDETVGRTLLPASTKPRSRRASFTSMHDVTNEQMRQARRRSLSRASESWLQDERAPRVVLQQQNPSPYALQETKPNHRRRSSHSSPRPKRNGMNVELGERMRASKNQSSKHGRSGAGVESQVSKPYNHHESPTGSESGHPPREPHSRKLFYRPSSVDLDRDAEAFEDMRLRNLQRTLLKRWVHCTRERLEHVRSLELQAVTKDFQTLKRQALDFWRAAYEQKRQHIREERFFEHLNNRAGQAYDLYLLTKSFTHWIQITAAAVAKTNEARQRFLFTKYFNAWYQFTVTNELKAERQGLKAPLKLLRRRAAQYYHDQINALEVYHANLTKYVFWRWFREWCDRAAPRYREQQLQRGTLGKWLLVSRKVRSLQVEVDSESVRRSLRKAFQTWVTKARIDVAGYHQAEAFRKSHLLSDPLGQWHAEAKLKVVAQEVMRMRDWRIARSKFSIWQLRTRMVFRADAVNRMRTLQNAYTAWNEQLRSQTLAARINERLVAEALYKWVIAERFIMMLRISRQHQKRIVLQSFLSKARTRRELLCSNEAQLTAARKQQLLGSTLSCWRDQTIANQTRSQMALEFYNPKLKQDTVEAIRLKINAQKRLEKWAQDARFYFLMTRHIALFRAATTERKKARERAAHAKMRRKCKINLARNVLHTWSRKLHEDHEACKKGDEVYLQNIHVLQQFLFRKWHTAASQRKQEATAVSTRYDDRVLEHCLGLIIDTSRHLYSLQNRAEQFYHLKMSEICSAQLRKFSMRAFEMRRREQDADAMHNRHWNKHVRNIIRHWATKPHGLMYRDLVSNAPTEKPLEREPTDAGYGTASNEDHGQSANGNELGATSRAEDWTAFDADLLEGSEWIPSHDEEVLATSTPLPAPGYLQTPSKRAARAKALANLSTTPVTPLRTPFAARLKAGSGSSPSQVRATTGRRGGLGFKSALGLNVKNSKEDG